MPTAPKNAKQPSDHQPKKGGANDTDRKVTVAGREWTVSRDALDDFELLDDLGAIEDGNAGRLPRVMRRLLGDEYKDALDHLRDEDTGRVAVEPAAEFISDLLGGLNPNS